MRMSDVSTMTAILRHPAYLANSDNAPANTLEDIGEKKYWENVE